MCRHPNITLDGTVQGRRVMPPMHNKPTLPSSPNPTKVAPHKVENTIFNGVCEELIEGNSGNPFLWMELTLSNVYTLAVGRPHQLGEMLAAKDQLGRTILSAAASSGSVETFRAVVHTVETHCRDQVRDVCGCQVAPWMSRHEIMHHHAPCMIQAGEANPTRRLTAIALIVVITAETR